MRDLPLALAALLRKNGRPFHDQSTVVATLRAVAAALLAAPDLDVADERLNEWADQIEGT